LNFVKIFNVKPDLLLACSVIASVLFEPAWGISLSMFSGVLKDISSVNSFGMNTLLFFLWSYLIIKLSRKVTLDVDYIQLALIFIITFLNNIVTRLVFILLGTYIPLAISLRIIFIEPLYTALVSFLFLRYGQRLLIDEPVPPLKEE